MDNHGVDDIVAPVEHPFRLATRIVGGWVPDRNEEGGGFCDRQLFEIFAEVLASRSLDPVGAPAVVHGVDVELENLFLRVAAFQFNRHHGFLDLALQRDLIADEVLFDHLLRDRRSTPGHASQVVDRRSSDCRKVDAVMFEEFGILGRQDGLDDDVGQLVIPDGFAVLAIVKLGEHDVVECVNPGYLR